jgi:hypothetical protein
MASTPVFWYLEDQVENEIANVKAQADEGEAAAKRIVAAANPLRDGQFVGVHADAFYRALDEFLSDAKRINDEIRSLAARLERAQADTNSTMQAITAIINS